MLLYGICIIVILLVVYLLATWNVSASEDYLYGFWVAEADDFCERAEIDSMMIFIGEPVRSWRNVTRTCYIIVMGHTTQGFTLDYTRGWAGPSLGPYSVSACARFDTEQIWDEDVTVTVNPIDGSLVITNGETVYAKLSKQHDTTNMAKALEASD